MDQVLIQLVLDKDAKELQAGLTAGKLPPWGCPRSPIDP